MSLNSLWLFKKSYVSDYQKFTTSNIYCYLTYNLYKQYPKLALNKKKYQANIYFAFANKILLNTPYNCS